MRENEFAVRIVPRSLPLEAYAICGNSVDRQTTIPHGPTSTLLPLYGRMRIPFKQLKPSSTRHVPVCYGSTTRRDAEKFRESDTCQV
jgi:hypothetical protein